MNKDLNTSVVFGSQFINVFKTHLVSQLKAATVFTRALRQVSYTKTASVSEAQYCNLTVAALQQVVEWSGLPSVTAWVVTIVS